MNLSRMSLYIIVLVIFSTAAFPFDRAAIHEQDLGSPVLSSRQHLKTVFAAKTALATLGTEWAISESVTGQIPSGECSDGYHCGQRLDCRLE